MISVPGSSSVSPESSPDHRDSSSSTQTQRQVSSPHEPPRPDDSVTSPQNRGLLGPMTPSPDFNRCLPSLMIVPSLCVMVDCSRPTVFCKPLITRFVLQVPSVTQAGLEFKIFCLIFWNHGSVTRQSLREWLSMAYLPCPYLGQEH